MKTPIKVAMVAAVVVMVMAVIAYKQGTNRSELNAGGTAIEAQSRELPRLVDLGADKCIPCKMMAPVLANLKTNYADGLEVEFIDVWKNPDAGRPYKIKLIPTQIFFDATGNERFRHEGFLAKEEILAKWKELGVDIGAPKAEAGSREGGAKVGQ